MFESSGFVDKSMLIKTIMTGPKSILVTAPRRFGKSTNLNMLKSFLSLKSCKNTEIINIFKTLQIYKDNEKFYNDSFCKYPVMYITFKSSYIRTYDEAIGIFLYSVNRSYKEHVYLLNSSLLKEEQINNCANWMYNWTKMSIQDLKISLELLSEYLFQHHKKPVIVLVDEYDCAINSALLENKIDEDVLSFIIEMTSCLIGSLAKENFNVNRTIATGVSYILSTGLSQINNLKHYRFLDDHNLVSFYGFTENEIDVILSKKEFQSYAGRKIVIKKWYNGYVCRRGQHIFNTHSFLSFLETGKFKSHWGNSGHGQFILQMLDNPELRLTITKLLANESISIFFQDYVHINDVQRLKKIYSENVFTPGGTDLLLSHFLELGYLTHKIGVESEDSLAEINEVKLPNLEVQKIIHREYKTYFIRHYNISSDLIKASPNTFIKYLIEHSKDFAESAFKSVKEAWNLFSRGIYLLREFI